MLEINLSLFLSIIFSIIAINFFLRNNFMVLENNRITNIDGLRGYLAIGVFFHHYIITYGWKMTGLWERPANSFFNNLGVFSVCMFFIVTGYLFSRVILSENLNVYSFFKKRVYRLMPLYYLVIILMFLVVFIDSNFELNVSLELLAKQIFMWLVFLRATMNDYANTSQVTAGVTWTLIYEWLFYLSVPVFFYLKRFKYLMFLIIFSLLYLSLNEVVFHSLNAKYMMLFFIGFIVYVVQDRIKFNFNFDTILMSTINLLLILLTIVFFDSYSVYHYLLLGLIFAMVVFGNSLFGLFKKPFSVALGEITYSIYLIHGIVLYILFTILFKDFVVNYGNVYFYILPLISILVVSISVITYKYIELPFMQKGKK